jgi:hypothetical protein
MAVTVRLVVFWVSVAVLTCLKWVSPIWFVAFFLQMWVSSFWFAAVLTVDVSVCPRFDCTPSRQTIGNCCSISWSLENLRKLQLLTDSAKVIYPTTEGLCAKTAKLEDSQLRENAKESISPPNHVNDHVPKAYHKFHGERTARSQ